MPLIPLIRALRRQRLCRPAGAIQGNPVLGVGEGGAVYFGLRFQVAGVAWHGGRSSKLANHVVSIHRKRRGQTGSGDSL